MVPIWFQTGDKIGPDIVSEARSVSESILNQFEIDFGSILQPFGDYFDGHVAGYDHPWLAKDRGWPQAMAVRWSTSVSIPNGS